MNKVLRIVKEPGRITKFVLSTPIGRMIPDEIYLKIMYKASMGKKLDLKNPKTFNEKLQWLKLHDRKQIYTTMVDKYDAKKYVADIIGKEHIIPTLGIWDKFDDIDFDALPNQFVLKCTHDSGGLVICKDKKTFDIEAARKKIEKCLKKNYYWSTREWPYKNVKPRILAEQYMEDSATSELRDYKLFSFNGVVKALFIATDRQNELKETTFDFFDADFKHLPFTNGHPNADVQPAKPETFEEMKALASKLSEGFPHLRVDFYEVNGKVYFGELTFSHWGGMMPFDPEKWDETFGNWIKLPDSSGGGYGLIKDDCVLWLHREKKKEKSGLVEYKFFCFNEKPKIVLVCKGTAHGAGRTNDYCNLDLQRYPFTSLNPNSEGELQKPIELPEMIRIAERLSKGTLLVRVDLYLIDGTIYFGETTFYHNAGFCKFNPEEWDATLGSWITLPMSRR